MTAVEWLYQILHEQNYIYEDMSEYLEQAKEMEKQQIIYAYQTSNISMMTAEQYYNETFKNTNK